MKTKLALVASLYCGLSSLASAFTLDFASYSNGTGLPLTINVPGYGDVSFATETGSLDIQTFAPASVKAISFDKSESIIITFQGATPVDVDNGYIGVGPGEGFTFDFAGVDPKVFRLTLTGTGPTANAGLRSVTFDQVPEPSASLLGAMGCALLVIRRKR